MAFSRFLTAFALFVLLAASACKKDTDTNTPDLKDPESVTIVQSANWITVGKDVISAGNAGGGGVINIALNELSPGVLRWMNAFSTQNYTNENHEMQVNTNNEVKIVKSFRAPTGKYHLKTIVDGHEWQINQVSSGGRLEIYKDGARINDYDDWMNYPRGTDYVQLAEDGFEVWGGGFTWNGGIFSFKTGKWKRNSFTGVNGWQCVTRYQGSTYLIDMGNTGSAGVYKEGGARDSGALGIEYRLIPQPSLVSGAFNPGPVMYTARYGSNYFMVYQNTQVTDQLTIYKLDLATMTLTLVQHRPLVQNISGGGQTAYFSEHAIMDNDNGVSVDEAGNLYAIERENEQFRIRKYLVAGGTEVVLAEKDFAAGAYLYTIRYFNGKLYAGLGLSKPDPSQGSNFSHYYLQLVRQK